jgi:hypothetical protein
MGGPLRASVPPCPLSGSEHQAGGGGGGRERGQPAAAAAGPANAPPGTAAYDRPARELLLAPRH